MKQPLLKRFAFAVSVCFVEYFIVPRFLLNGILNFPNREYQIEVEPLLPSLFFIVALGLLVWRDKLTFQLKTPQNLKLIVLHVVSYTVFLFYLSWLSTVFPFQPLEPSSIFVKLAQSINPSAGAFTFRYRVLIYILFIVSFLSIFQSLLSPPKGFRIKYVIPAVAGIIFGEYFFSRIVDFLFWKFMKNSVGVIVYGITKLFFGENTFYIPGTDGLPEVGTHQFHVAIAAPCAGLEGIALFLVVLATVLWIERGNYRKRNALIFCLFGIIAMYLFNILRIFVLILVGHFYDPDFAVGIWHAYSGIFIYAIAIFVLFRKGFSYVVK